MKTFKQITLLSLLVLFITTQSFHCESQNQNYNGCSNYIEDTAFVKLNLVKKTPTLKVYDTLWFESTISDTFYNRQGSDKIVSPINEIHLQIQPYRIVKTDTVPFINYANIEFNPVLQDGTISTNAYFTGYNFIFRRNQPYNYLKAGFVPGKTGLYIFIFTHSLNDEATIFDVYSPDNYCKSYHGLSKINTSEQNIQYWDSLKVSGLHIRNYNWNLVQKQDPNYFFINVTN